MFEGFLSNKELFEFLKGSGEGRVMGVFSSGVYIRFDDRTLMLHDSKYGSIPFGAAMDGFHGQGRELGFEAGMEISFDREVLRCKDTGFSLKLSWQDTEIKAVEHSALSVFAAKAEAFDKLEEASALNIFAPCLLEKIDKNTIDDTFARTAFSALVDLREAMDKSDAAAMRDALLGLIGLGRGLTPSMDDFICGMLFVLHYAQSNWRLDLPCVELLSAAVLELAPQRTNIYSAAYLLSSASGGDFSLMRRCIEYAQSPDFEICAENLLSVGSSSGADMLCGMCFAANYILKQR